MIGRKFTNLSNGKIVEIKDAFEDIIILNDGTKIKASKLMDKNSFEEFIDPRSFFENQTLLNSFAQKIKQIPDEVLNNMGTENKRKINEDTTNSDFRPRFDDLAILQADPELEKEELRRKYGIKDDSIESPILQAQKQLDKFKSLLEEIQNDNEEDVIKIDANRDFEEEEDFDEMPQPRTEKRREYKQEPLQEIRQEIKQEDPIITMFKNVKRNKDFSINIEIKNSIPRPDFIEMMEDSYNTSIIEFLADEFTNEILKNPNLIKDKIIAEIKEIVYKKESRVEPKELKVIQKTVTTPKRTRTKKEIVNK